MYHSAVAISTRARTLRLRSPPLMKSRALSFLRLSRFDGLGAFSLPERRGLIGRRREVSLFVLPAVAGTAGGADV